MPMSKRQQLGSRVNDEFPDRQGRRIPSGHVEPESASITFPAVLDAEDECCQ